MKMNLRGKKKWLLSCSYNPKKVQISNHLAELSKSTDLYLTKYDQLLFLGDFDARVEDSAIKNFCSRYNLTSMLIKSTCFENPHKSSCIDLILTNCPRSFKNSCAIESGISDFHKLAVSVRKTSYKKTELKSITYRSYKSFYNNNFREELWQVVSKRENCDTNFKSFISSCNKILDQHAPQKKKYLRGNQSPFMNKNLFKAIMLRSKFRNIFLKNRTEENRRNYSKQRNLCATLLRKSKREYFGILDEKKICDNKKFWSVVKPLLSNKVVSNENITLPENNNIVENDEKTATLFNNFLSNVIKSLNIRQYNETEPVIQNINDPLIVAIIKYRSHPSIIEVYF